MLLAFLRSSLSSLLRQLPAGEDDDGHVAQPLVRAAFRQQLEAGHVRQPQIEHDAVEAPLTHRLERLGAGAERRDLDVVVAEELDDR